MKRILQNRQEKICFNIYVYIKLLFKEKYSDNNNEIALARSKPYRCTFEKKSIKNNIVFKTKQRLETH
jgi:hypothetical protein